jgi:hypothetical protein
LETGATGNETVGGKVFSFRDANTLFEGGIKCIKGTQIIKKSNRFLFMKGGTTKKGKTKQKS